VEDFSKLADALVESAPAVEQANTDVSSGWTDELEDHVNKKHDY